MPVTLEQKGKDVATESKAMAEVATSLGKVLAALNKANDSASKTQKEWKDEDDE
jgi:hypothetical protein